MNEKQCLILNAAFKVFARFGLKKTSIDDIAKAADISRQGVYLHFKNKEEIFKASVEMYLDERIQASMGALNTEAKLEDRLLSALFEWFGKNIGLLHQDAADVIEEGLGLVKASYETNAKTFKAALAKSIQKDQKLGKKMAEDIAEILVACGFCWKHELTAQEDFMVQMKSTIRLLLRNAA